MNNKRVSLLLAMFLVVTYLACSTVLDPDTEEATEDETDIVLVENDADHDDSGDYSWDSSQEIAIAFNGSSITVNGSGATASGSTVTITAAGTYSLTGTLDDGQVIVNTNSEEIVRLILNGVNLNCSTNAPIYVVSADKVMLILADNTENTVTDGSSYNLGDADEPNAAIFSKADLTAYGNGKLTVNANYKDGIASKDGLIIASGTLNINSADDGIRGKDYLIIKNGAITVTAGGAGLKSTNTDDPSRGYITIENGMLDISAAEDAIEAEKDVLISSGEIGLSADEKGINASINATIDGGTVTITAVDDAMHSNGYITINDGTLTLSSSDDAIHANEDLVINNGEITITQSYEGIESSEGDITINGGTIHLVSSDDGINLAAGGDSGPGQSSTNSYLYINDGYIFVNAGGDGVDANASVVMTAGDLIVSGSSASSNSALDYNGSFAMNGGVLVAAGSSSHMTQAVSTSSGQNSILINFSSKQNAGTLIHIVSQDGQYVLTFSPAKSYQSVAFSSALLTTGATYTVYVGGSSTGTPTDGVYQDGTYSGGTAYKSFTISSKVTTVN